MYTGVWGHIGVQEGLTFDSCQSSLSSLVAWREHERDRLGTFRVGVLEREQKRKEKKKTEHAPRMLEHEKEEENVSKPEHEKEEENVWKLPFEHANLAPQDIEV